MPAEVKQDILYNFITNTAMAVEGFQQMIHGMDDLDEGMEKVEKNTSFLNQTLSTFVANIGVKLVGALTQAVGLIKNAFAQFVDFAKGATMQAARIEVQMRTLALTAGNAGERFEDVVEHLNALRAAGIKTGEAIGILSQFLANELPIKMVTELARRAQDMAVVIGTDSTEAFQRFNNFLQTGNSEWIRTMGIMKTGNQMLEEYARTQGLVVEAMTARERKEALVQGLMKETLRYEGAYEEAMKDPYKRWTSLPRLISNVVEALGSLFVPMMGTVVDVVSDALEKIERLFRVTKKEAKETGEVIGTWKEGFLRLRAVVTAFANWFMSIWNRITGGFNEASESMMDRFVNAIVRGVRAAANALRRFATFVASIFGGRAPKEVTPEGIAATKPPAKPEGEPRVAPIAPEPYEEAIGKPKKLPKPVAPPDPELMAKWARWMEKLRKLNDKLAEATNAVAKAQAHLEKAQKRLEVASEKVYDIRRKIQRLELDWAEIPERFIRGRRKQLQLELQAAQHEEHQRREEVKAERDRVKAAKAYRSEVQKAANEAERFADKFKRQIDAQIKKYDAYIEKLNEALDREMRLIEPIQAIVNEFESLDDLVGVYLEEIEEQLMPAFASIEESVLAILSNFEGILAFAKGLPEMAEGWLEKLREVRQWWDDLPDWVKNILKGLGIAVALNFVAGGAVGNILTTVLIAAFNAAKLIPGVGWTIAAGAIALFIAIKPFLDPEVRQAWADAWKVVFDWGDVEGLEFDEQGRPKIFKKWFEGIATAADVTLKHTPIIDRFIEGIDNLFRGSKDDMAEAAEEGIARPVTDVMERMSRNLVEESLIPDMVNAILDWMKQLADRLGEYLDQMAAKFRILEDSILGLEPALADVRQFASGGNIKVVNIKGPFTIGGGLTETDVKRAIYDAIFDLL